MQSRLSTALMDCFGTCMANGGADGWSTAWIVRFPAAHWRWASSQSVAGMVSGANHKMTGSTIRPPAASTATPTQIQGAGSHKDTDGSLTFDMRNPCQHVIARLVCSKKMNIISH